LHCLLSGRQIIPKTVPANFFFQFLYFFSAPGNVKEKPSNLRAAFLELQFPFSNQPA